MKTKTLIDGKKVPFETRTRNTNKGYVLLTDKEIVEEDARIARTKVEKKEYNDRYDVKRKKFYKKKEEAGELPATILENIDELWKALETLELQGVNLPKKSASIIKHRRAVKTKYPKD